MNSVVDEQGGAGGDGDGKDPHMGPIMPELPLQEIAALCRRYGVRQLALFGSALRADFDLEHSDVDFLVEFEPLEPPQRAQAYFGLLFALEELLGRSVDLAEMGAIRNPYVRRSIACTQETLYVAA